MGGPMAIIPEPGVAHYKTLNNNANAKWTRDSGLRRLNIAVGLMFMSAATTGFDASLINGLQTIPLCEPTPLAPTCLTYNS